MRPNIEITHTTNGRVKDFANEHDLNVAEAYEELIKFGLENYGQEEISPDGAGIVDEPEPDPAPEQRELQEPVDDLDQPDGALHGEGQPLNAAGDDVEEDRPDRDVQAVESVETPALTQDRDTFETAAYAILAELRSHGPLGRKDYLDRLHDEYAAGYDNERTWWRRVAKPVLEAHPDLEAPPGGQPWRFPE